MPIELKGIGGFRCNETLLIFVSTLRFLVVLHSFWCLSIVTYLPPQACSFAAWHPLAVWKPFLIDAVLFQAIPPSNLFFYLNGSRVPWPELLVLVYFFLQLDVLILLVISTWIKDSSFCSLNKRPFTGVNLLSMVSTTVLLVFNNLWNSITHGT